MQLSVLLARLQYKLAQALQRPGCGAEGQQQRLESIHSLSKGGEGKGRDCWVKAGRERDLHGSCQSASADCKASS